MSSFCAMMIGPIVFVLRCKAKSRNARQVSRGASGRSGKKDTNFCGSLQFVVSFDLTQRVQGGLTLGYFKIPAFKTK